MATLYDLLNEGAKDLGLAGIENSHFEAMCLLEEAFAINKSAYYARQNTSIDENSDAEKLNKFKEMIAKRKKHIPLQYILGKWDFYDSTFYLGEGVLIPRPETETLVELALDKIRQNNYKACFDLCAGSGCIGLSIAKACPKTQVFLFEKHQKAYNYLEKNAKALALPNVKLIKYDIFNSYDEVVFQKPDIIVSNPPYIPAGELSTLQAEVQLEPKTALDGGLDGLNFYRAIADLWADKIKGDLEVLLEVGEGQAGLVGDIFGKKGFEISLKKDIYKVLRFVLAKRLIREDNL